MALSREDAQDQLTATTSGKRRAAAKRLRSISDPASGPFLLAALKSEINDDRTWETQYQMIMALGSCHCHQAYPFLQRLYRDGFGSPAAQTALADTLTRLEICRGEGLNTLLKILSQDPMSANWKPSYNGSLRAIALMRYVPDPNLRSAVLLTASRLTVHHSANFWLVVAAAGWPGSAIREFLTLATTSFNEENSVAARDSLNGSYGKYPIL